MLPSTFHPFVAQGLDQTIVIPNTYPPGSGLQMPFFPRVGFCVPVPFTLRRHAFLGFYAFGSSIFLLLLQDCGDGSPILVKERGGREGYLSVPWLSSFPAQAAPSSAPRRSARKAFALLCPTQQWAPAAPLQPSCPPTSAAPSRILIQSVGLLP